MHTYWDQIKEEIYNPEFDGRYSFTNIQHKVNKKKSCCRIPAKKVDIKTQKNVRAVYISKREGDCLQLCVAGLTMEQTAVKLGISHRTVEYYLNNVKGKIGCRAKPELIQLVLNSNFKKVFPQTN